MHPILVLVRKDLLRFFRDRAAVLVTFLVPILLIFLFGFVFGLNKKDSGPTGITLAVVNQSKDSAALDLIEALKEEKTFRVVTTRKMPDGSEAALSEEDVRSALNDNKYRFALVLPEDLISGKDFGVHFKFLSNPRNEIETQTVQGMLQKTLFSKVPSLLGMALQRRAESYLGNVNLDRFNRSMAELVGNTFGIDNEEIYRDLQKGGFGLGAGKKKEADPTLRRLDSDTPSAKSEGRSDEKANAEQAEKVLSRIVRIDNEQVAGKNVKNPMASRLVGGYAIMFLLFAVNGVTVGFFEERNSGIFARLLSGPVKRSDILWAKFGMCVLLGLLQLLVLFVVGNWLYSLDLSQHLVPLVIVSLFAAAACGAYGLFIAALSPSREAAMGLNTLLVLSMSAIGGAWFPVSFMPEFIQNFSRLTLVYWSMEGFTSVLWAGEGVGGILPNLGILALITSLFMIVAVWRLRKSNIFN